MGKLLLLTATVTPPSDALNLVRMDPAVRMQDYLGALEFYLALPASVIDRIVFVDNSLSDLSKVEALVQRFPDKKVELISFSGLDYPSSYGRGYGELKLLDHALASSKLIAAMPAAETFWKGTGRLKLLNIARLIKTAPKTYDLYCDLKNRPIRWMELRFFSCSASGYRRLLKDTFHSVREDKEIHAAEVIMRGLIEPKLHDSMVIPRFRSQPWVEGVQGAYNTNYAHGYRNRAKFLGRRAVRKLVPGLWI